MEPNIILPITAVVVVLAAVILTYGFGPKRKNVFIFDLLEAIGEPTRRPISAESRNSRRRNDRESPRIPSRMREGTVAGGLCNPN